MRLLSEPNSATNNADSTPTAMPMRMSTGTPPTTITTPGTTAAPISNSRGSNLRRVSHGSMKARNTGPNAMQVAPTEALDSLIAA
ncbi:hypothetical protein RLIN73S_03723 [Rhodanobacter lindaniclasticus]